MSIRIRDLTLALLLIAGLCPGAARSGPATGDPFLAGLAGRWDVSGTVLGKAAHYRGEGRWLLQGGWMCLTLIDTQQPPQYEASVYLGFDAKANDYVAHWLDRFGAAGARVVATGQRAGQKLVLLFPYPEGAFRDTLTLADDGASGTLLLEVQKSDGSWSTFASYILERVPHIGAR